MTHAVLALLFVLPLPPVTDARGMLPPKAVVEAALELNGAYQAHLEALLATEAWPVRAQRLRDVLEETRSLRNPWQDALFVQREENSDYCRRWHLREVKKHLGDERYYRGQWPPPVPVWRLMRFD